MWVPMKIEAKMRANPLTAIILARVVRPLPESPRVSERKIGVFPTGLTIGNSAPTTRKVFSARSPNMVATSVLLHDLILEKGQSYYPGPSAGGYVDRAPASPDKNIRQVRETPIDRYPGSPRELTDPSS